MERPKEKKNRFLVLKKRLKEALFKTLEIVLFFEVLKWKAGLATSLRQAQADQIVELRLVFLLQSRIGFHNCAALLASAFFLRIIEFFEM